jgi:non-histone protein 10
LRIKRGHRKTDQDSKGTPSASFNHHPVDPSPAPSDIGDAAKTRDANGVDEERKQSTKNAPRDGYELYCEKERPILENKAKDSDINVDEELERGWKELQESDKDEYRTKAQEEAKEDEASSAKKNDDKPQDDKSQDDKSQDDKSQDGKSQDGKSQDDKAEGGDEDVEMKNYDTEDAEPQADKEGED